MPEVDEREPDAPTDPPIGWAQKSKVPPGMKDPDDQRPGLRIRVMGFTILVVALLLIVFLATGLCLNRVNPSRGRPRVTPCWGLPPFW